MLTKPPISDHRIKACLRDSFGLHIAQVTFLPLGWVNNAVYRVTTDSGASYFLKLRQLSYYRYQRTVVEIAERAEQIFGMQGSAEERRKVLGLMNQFLPNNVVEIAHRSYQQLA